MISPATSEKILRNQIITKLLFSNQRTSYLSYLAKYQMNLKNNKNSFEKKKKNQLKKRSNPHLKYTSCWLRCRSEEKYRRVSQRKTRRYSPPPLPSSPSHYFLPQFALYRTPSQEEDGKTVRWRVPLPQVEYTGGSERDNNNLHLTRYLRVSH